MIVCNVELGVSVPEEAISRVDHLCGGRHASGHAQLAKRATMAIVELIALILAGLSFVVSVVGTALSNKRSSEALAESRKAAASALWSGIQEAVQRLIGFDPAREAIGERLANLRIAGIALVDELDSWAGLDTWLEAERALGAVLGREVMETAKPDDSVDERLAALDPYQMWAMVLGQNLRRFRNVGYDADAAQKLRAIAENQATAIRQKHGWPLAPTSMPGVKALD